MCYNGGYEKGGAMKATTMKSTTVRARVDVGLKMDVESVLDKLGLSMSDAIKLFMAQIKLRKGIPFELSIPNRKTLRTFKETDENHHVTRCDNAKDMFKKLGI